MKFSGCSLGLSPSIRERELLTMAARTRLFAVHRHSLVVKEMAPELDFRRGHRVICWYRRTRKWFWDPPFEGSRLSKKRNGNNDNQRRNAPNGCRNLLRLHDYFFN